MPQETVKTFRTRAGAINEGIDYEILNIANLALNLVTNAQIKDFHLSSNDENFGSFDDIVIEIETENDKQTYALQLKHKDRGNLPIENLKQKKGDFSIKKYFNSVQTFANVGHTFILYTNLKCNIPDNTIFQLADEDFQIKITKHFPNFVFNISEKTNFCYKFEVVEESNSYDYSPHILLYKSFFDKFFLYVDQNNARSFKLHFAKKFAKKFEVTDNESDRYLTVISDWSKEKGVKEKLNKTWVGHAIALQILSSSIKPISFEPVNEKIEILREAIDCFNITMVEDVSYKWVRTMWGDIKNEIQDVTELNKLRKRYHLDVTYITCIDNINPTLLSKILWLQDKVPLIVEGDKRVRNVMQLCPHKKIILLRGTCVEEEWLENVSTFKNLLDLKPKTEHFECLLETFTFSLQGKGELPLSTIKEDEEYLKILTTDDLLKILHEPFYIGGKKESLPEPYIERCLLSTIIDVKYLEETRDSTLIILDCVKKLDNVEYKIKCKDFVSVGEYLEEASFPRTSRNFGHHSSFRHRMIPLANRNSSFTILVNKSTTSSTKFQKIRSKNKDIQNFHQFRVLDGGNLEWVRSTGNIAQLEEHFLQENCLVEEKNISFSQPRNTINIIASNPGMGKTELLKSFKNNSPSDFWTLIIYPEDIYTFFKQNGRSDINAFITFILNRKYSASKDREFFRICVQRNKVTLVWDALDEISSPHLEDVTNMILEFSERGWTQWVTTRRHLKRFLESTFKVFSLDLNQFNSDEQRFYIQRRLTDVASVEEIEDLRRQIQSIFMLKQHIDILGIPLQIFMLTELFRQNQDKYLALLNNTFVLTDLYHYFIEEKLNIHCATTPIADFRSQSVLETTKQEILNCYAKVALTVIFPHEKLSRLNINFEEELVKVEKDYFRVGVINEIVDKIPRFVHTSFAEFLVAVYFSKNLSSLCSLGDTIFESSYVNLRFFFDLLLAHGSQVHVAVLYKRFDVLTSCGGDVLTCKDAGGRTPLHLGSSWGKRYPQFHVHKTVNGYTVDDETNFDQTEDTHEYLKIIEYLVESSNITERDHLFEMTPLEYARKSNCIVAEMKIMNKRNTHLQTSEEDRIVNILFYAARFGYYEAFHLLEQRQEQVDKIKKSCILYLFSRFRNRESSGTIKHENLINVSNKDGVSLLYRASRHGHFDVVKFLLESGVSVDVATQKGKTPLWTAARNGHYKVVNLLVNCCAAVNLGDNKGFTPFYLACENGHIKIAKLLKDSGANINQAINIGHTPLHIASLQGYKEIVKFLLDSHCPTNVETNDCETPLHMAIYNEHERIVELLIESHITINHANREGITPLHLASGYGNNNIVKCLLASGATVNCTCEDGITPLSLAAINGHVEVVQTLLVSSADANIADDEGTTPLYLASMNGFIQVVRILIPSGARVNHVTAEGVTVLNMASTFGHLEVVKLLVASGAKVHHFKEKFPSLVFAALAGHLKIVKFLIMSGAKVNRVAQDGCSPLIAACIGGHLEVAKFLITRSANVYLRDHFGDCALLVSCENGHKEIVQYLLECGAKVNNANVKGETALHKASKLGDIEVVKYLVNKGANVNYRHPYCLSPLAVACSRGYLEVVKFLVECGADVNSGSRRRDTPLGISFENGHQEIVRYLIDAKASF